MLEGIPLIDAISPPFPPRTTYCMTASPHAQAGFAISQPASWNGHFCSAASMPRPRAWLPGGRNHQAGWPGLRQRSGGKGGGASLDCDITSCLRAEVSHLWGAGELADRRDATEPKRMKYYPSAALKYPCSSLTPSAINLPANKHTIPGSSSIKVRRLYTSANKTASLLSVPRSAQWCEFHPNKLSRNCRVPKEIHFQWHLICPAQGSGGFL